MGFIVIRHGSTTFKEFVKASGGKCKAKSYKDAVSLSGIRKRVSEDSPLSEKGIQQIEEISRQIGEYYIGAVYRSEALRTRQTYDILKKNNPSLPEAIITDGLNQITKGVLHGIINEDSEQYFETLTETSRRGRAMSCNYGDPDGETFLSAAHRIYTFLDSIQSLATETNVLLITHKSAMRAIETYFNRNLHENDSIFDFDPSNSEIVTYGKILTKDKIENRTKGRTVTPGDLARATMDVNLNQHGLRLFKDLIGGIQPFIPGGQKSDGR